MGEVQEAAPPASPGQREEGSTLVSARVWTVLSPPPLNSVSGTLIPKALSHKRLRKVSIEVHQLKARRASQKNGGGGGGTYEECLVRFLQPATKAVQKTAKAEHREHKQHANHTAAASSSSAGPASVKSQNHPSVADDASVMLGDHEYSNLLHKDYFASPDFDQGWEDKYRFPLSCMSIKGTNKSGVYVKIQLGQSKHTRQLIFDTVEEAEDFCAVVKQETKLEKDRGESKMRLAFEGKDMPAEPTEQITFLLEMVSAWNLPAGDLYFSDPYVIVSHGRKEIHRTKYIPKT